MGPGRKQLPDKLSTVGGVESDTEIVVSEERLEELIEGESPNITEEARKDRTSNILQDDSPDRGLASTGADLFLGGSWPTGNVHLNSFSWFTVSFEPAPA